MILEHANITVESVKESIKFLEAAFPESTIRGEGHLHGDASLGRWVHFGTDTFYVALQENATNSPRSDVTYEHDGINHIGFVVEELDALLSRMRDRGYELSPASAMEDHPHRRRAYLFDGNGVEWEFVEYLSDERSERNDYTR
jgi:catechol 2,3-dioxygenase-like lactoylglutathione lyase family enzyme